MALNCKPGVIAWIVFPPTPREVALGLTNLNGRVVKVLHMHPASPPGAPSWVVDPPQRTRTVLPFLPANQGLVAPNTVFDLAAVPDSCLRPFTDFPPEEIEQLQRELAS